MEHVLGLRSQLVNTNNANEDNGAVSSKPGKVALFWDESFLWGLIAFDVFTQLSINFDLITASDIHDGALDAFDILFVPGGWASNKSKSLGDSGKENIRRFIEDGGSYLGFCGGAGLALQHKDGLGLVPVMRKSTHERVPSFSGKIQLHRDHISHPIWSGTQNETPFHAWWPGQFLIPDDSNVTILASYGAPEDGSYVADVPVNPSVDWDSLEKSYASNLNPARIKGEPAVLEASYGKGKVLLSYLHFETPGDELGHKVLLNMLEYLAGREVIKPEVSSQAHQRSCSRYIEEPLSDNTQAPASTRPAELVVLARELESLAQDLIDFGEQNSLWSWRNSWILQWRRGVRGIEYCTLHAMLKRLPELAQADSKLAGETKTHKPDEDYKALISELDDIKMLCLPFFDKAKRLLTLEHNAMNHGPISPLVSDNEQIQRMRAELFSNSKSFGGYYKQIIDRIDAILLKMLK